jgi:hypothetical protein
MTRGGMRIRTVGTVAGWPLLCGLLLMASATFTGAAEAQRRGASDAGCAVCHGELELLRQNVASLGRARELLVTPAHIEGSAHDGMTCGECHTGYRIFPHPQTAATATCSGCHEPAEREWAVGQHARETVGGEIAAPCASCHGIHQMAQVADLDEGSPMLAVNDRCISCHQADALPPTDPHAAQVGCWSCHSAHSVHATTDPGAAVSPLLQARTCGTCHDEAAVAWRRDAHGAASLRAVGELNEAFSLPLIRETPVCTGCHGGHGMIPVADGGFALASVAACQQCHQHAASTFFASYHGKATALGSRVVATCYDCHGAHEIYPDDDPRSTVHSANLVATCQECHEYARPAFVLYDSHPDVFNRQRNPWIFYSFWFMNTLLVGVLSVFGLHTVLWWVRLYIDRRRGVVHGPHGTPHHGPPGGHSPAEREDR